MLNVERATPKLLKQRKRAKSLLGTVKNGTVINFAGRNAKMVVLVNVSVLPKDVGNIQSKFIVKDVPTQTLKVYFVHLNDR
jgi:hypothetical protein